MVAVQEKEEKSIIVAAAPKSSIFRVLLMNKKYFVFYMTTLSNHQKTKLFKLQDDWINISNYTLYLGTAELLA